MGLSVKERDKVSKGNLAKDSENFKIHFFTNPSIIKLRTVLTSPANHLRTAFFFSFYVYPLSMSNGYSCRSKAELARSVHSV